MTSKDASQVLQIYNNEMKKNFNGYFMYSQEEIIHKLMPIKGTLYTVVVENAKKKITDFVSFYGIPSTILRDESGHGYT